MYEQFIHLAAFSKQAGDVPPNVPDMDAVNTAFRNAVSSKAEEVVTKEQVAHPELVDNETLKAIAQTNPWTTAAIGGGGLGLAALLMADKDKKGKRNLLKPLMAALAGGALGYAVPGAVTEHTLMGKITNPYSEDSIAEKFKERQEEIYQREFNKIDPNDYATMKQLVPSMKNELSNQYDPAVVSALMDPNTVARDGLRKEWNQLPEDVRQASIQSFTPWGKKLPELAGRLEDVNDPINRRMMHLGTMTEEDIESKYGGKTLSSLGGQELLDQAQAVRYILNQKLGLPWIHANKNINGPEGTIGYDMRAQQNLSPEHWMALRGAQRAHQFKYNPNQLAPLHESVQTLVDNPVKGFVRHSISKMPWTRAAFEDTGGYGSTLAMLNPLRPFTPWIDWSTEDLASTPQESANMDFMNAIRNFRVNDGVQHDSTISNFAYSMLDPLNPLLAIPYGHIVRGGGKVVGAIAGKTLPKGFGSGVAAAWRNPLAIPIRWPANVARSLHVPSSGIGVGSQIANQYTLPMISSTYKEFTGKDPYNDAVEKKYGVPGGSLYDFVREKFFK